MFRSTFTVDSDLRISSWEGSREHLRHLNDAEVIGRLYHELLPRLLCEGEDAVGLVIRSGNSLILKGYEVPCFFGSSCADVTIDPVYDCNRMIEGARVRTEAHPGCTLSRKLERSQPLIDIGTISTTLAHGVRSPLNAIKGAVVYLHEKYSEEPTLVEFTGIIEEEIARLDQFITKFLSASFDEEGYCTTDLNTLLKKIVAITTLQASASNISLQSDYGEIPLIMVNAFQLEHAILNVVNNAIEAMPDGGTLRFTTSGEMINGTRGVAICISDSGPGISAGKLDELLYPQKCSSGRRGKGFGLFITREIVRHHGGELAVKSSKGVGTDIRILLPAGDIEGKT